MISRGYRNKQNLHSQARLVLIESDATATSFVAQMNFPGRLLQTGDLAQWSKIIDANFGLIGILELTTRFGMSQLSDRLAAVHQLKRHGFGTSFFAVASPDLRQFEAELLICGFAGVFFSNSDAPRFANFAQKHLNSVDWPGRSIEEQLSDDLPWEYPV